MKNDEPTDSTDRPVVPGSLILGCIVTGAGVFALWRVWHLAREPQSSDPASRHWAMSGSFLVAIGLAIILLSRNAPAPTRRTI
jgi:hypothetical protein